MAQSRPTTTTDGAKALAHEITSLRRRVRELELRPDPTGGGGGTASLEFFTAESDSAPGDAGILDVDSRFYWQFDLNEQQSGGFTRVGGGITGQDAITIPSAGLWCAHIFVPAANPVYDLVGDGVTDPTSYDHLTRIIKPDSSATLMGGVVEANDEADDPLLRFEVLYSFYVETGNIGGSVWLASDFYAFGTGGSSHTLVSNLQGHPVRLSLFKVGVAP
jgi:hypothetical protein